MDRRRTACTLCLGRRRGNWAERRPLPQTARLPIQFSTLASKPKSTARSHSLALYPHSVAQQGSWRTMLAQRLNARTVLHSERVRPPPPWALASSPLIRLDRVAPADCSFALPCTQDVGTQTSLSFETSSSIRNEVAAYLEEERLLQEQSKDDDDDELNSYDRNQYESLTLAELEMVRSLAIYLARSPRR